MRSRPTLREKTNMNDRNRTLVAATMCAMLLAGCASAPDKAASGADAAATAMADKPASVEKDISTMVAAAFGKGTYEMADGTPVTFAFDAYSHNDGSVGGFINLRGNLPGGTIEFDGEVTCFTKDSPNNIAWIGGTITRNASLNPGFLRAQNMVGSEMWFRVRGAGGDSENTRLSAPGFSGDNRIRNANDYCEKRAWEANDAGTFVVVNGTLGIFP